ncbi:ABC transporter substrate-binding protein [Streptomyces fimicarius]|uniref:ABC transporter substrate-binding protein n=1 Tax=Streptomyces griseus TaxID=1911 RepID=UPI003696A539
MVSLTSARGRLRLPVAASRTRSTTRALGALGALLTVTVALAGCSASADATGKADAGATADAAATGSDGGKRSGDTAPAPRLRIAAAGSLALSVPLTGLAESPEVARLTDGVTTTQVATPDAFRALLTSGRADVATLPTLAAANLANRGVGVRLLGVVDADLVKVIGPAGAKGWPALRGKTVHVPFKGDAADVTFRDLAQRAGLTPDEDFTVRYATGLPELVGAVASGTAEFAVLPEHFATAARQQAPGGAEKTAEVLDLQDEWERTTGGTMLAQSAVIVRTEFATAHPELVKALRTHFARTGERLSSGKATDAELTALAKTSHAPEPLVSALLPALDVRFVEPGPARADITALLERALKSAPRAVGGKLPGDGFYGD